MKSRKKKKQGLKNRRIRQIIRLGTVILVGVAVLSCVCLIFGKIAGGTVPGGAFRIEKTYQVDAPEITELLLTPNEYSRPQTELSEVNGIVVHYTANPGTDAVANRNYFENLKDTHSTKVSSHFIIGLDGEIIQCVPLEEIAYASNERNADTISIECCHPDETGEFTKETYQSLIRLVAWLCGQYNLKMDNILRHYDVTGKDCPRYFVKNETEWETLKTDVFTYIEEIRSEKK
jgi:N-acetylmuramoyl-L-alanine amidase CwlA